MNTITPAQMRRLTELIEVLAGQRGNDAQRAVTLGELRALQERVNVTVKTITDSGLGGLQDQVTEIDAQIALARAEALAANNAASAVQANLDSEVAGLQTQIDAIVLEYDGPEGAVAAAEAAAADAIAAKTAAEAAKASAQTAATDALSSKNAAATSATSAAGSATAAANHVTTAQTAATNASGSASSAGTSAATATNAANAAGQSATAAASSASTAQTHATSAETSATAANSARTAAETARSQAQTSASNAATSATNAASSASSAASSATTAANSATTAGAQAAAAATSANTAATRATEAAQSASSSATSATTAATQASNAANSATQAASSATNAAGSASSASTSATTAATARGDAVKIVGNFQFAFGKDGWSASATAETTPAGTIITAAPTANAALRVEGAQSVFWGRRIAVELTKQYRVRFRVRATGAAASTVYAGVATYTASGTLETTAPGSHRYCAAAGVSVPADGVWRVYEGIITGGGNANHNQFRATTAFAVPMFIVNFQQDATVVAEVDECSIEEVTAEQNAAALANAAATSASTATAKASEASQSAISAASSATNASTSAANASTSAVNASTAATNAGSSASLALSYQQTAANIVSKGLNILADTFLITQDANNWGRFSSQGTLTKAANEIYTIGQTWTFEILSGNQDGIQTESTDSQWRGAADAEAYAVDVDFTLVAGVIDGAGVAMDWINTGNTVFRATASLAASARGSIVLGQPMTATVVLRRPTNFSGTFSFNRFRVAANWSPIGNGAKTIKFHRAALRVATAEELGAGQVATAISAAVSTESAARANEDAALAAQINSVSASVGSLSATVSSQGTALASIDGKLQASYAFRVKAGTSGAQLELIASSDPSGAVSVARIDATNILLNGTVSAPLIAAEAITADKIAASAVTATKIAAGSITAGSAIIADAAITSAKIADAAITTAKIGLAQITTAVIQDGAVTNEFAAFTSGSISVGTSYTQVQSLAFTSSGGPMSVLFVATATRFYGPVQVRLNGSAVQTFQWTSELQNTAIFTGSSVVNSTFYLPSSNTLGLRITPGAGNHTLTVWADNGSGESASFSARYLYTSELKR